MLTSSLSGSQRSAINNLLHDSLVGTLSLAFGALRGEPARSIERATAQSGSCSSGQWQPYAGCLLVAWLPEHPCRSLPWGQQRAVASLGMRKCRLSNLCLF